MMDIMINSNNYNKNTSKKRKLAKTNNTSYKKKNTILSGDTNEIPIDKFFEFPLKFKSKYRILNSISENGFSILLPLIVELIAIEKELAFISYFEIRKIVTKSKRRVESLYKN